MKNLIYILFGFVLITSCTNEETFPNELAFELENGGFVRFVDLEAFTTVVDFTDFTSTYSETRTIEDPNNNLTSVSYDLIANIGSLDSTIVAEDVVTSSTFPFDITLSQQLLAQFLGINPEDILAGDNFNFNAKATRNDGVEFNTDAVEFITDVQLDGEGNLIEPDSTLVKPNGTFDPNDLAGNTFVNGNTEANLYSSGYGNAMDFTISLACPFVPAEAVGMYLITNDPFETSLDYDSPIEAVLNADETGIIFKDLFKHPEGYDVEFIFSDPALGAVTISPQPAWHCDNFGCPYGEGRVDGEGSYFTCIGLVNVNLWHRVDLGSFGNFNLRLQKM